MENAVMAELDHSRMVDWFESAEMTMHNARKDSQLSREYYDDRQLTAKEIKALQERGQPIVVDNRIKPKVDTMSGIEIQGRTEPRAFPRTPKHEQDAEAATDALRFVLDNNNFDATRTLVAKELLIEGYGGAEVRLDTKGDQVEVVIEHYPWSRLFHDPYSMREDFSDARYLGHMRWADKAVAMDEAETKEAKGVLAMTGTEATFSDTYEDRPADLILWGDAERERIRIVTIYYRNKGQWYWAEYTRAGILRSGLSPYVNEHGETVCPLILESMYINRDNERYGKVKSMRPLNDEVNKRRSKMLHLVTTRQLKVTGNGVSDIGELRRQLARPDGIIQAPIGGDVDLLELGGNATMAQAQFQLLQEAKQSLDVQGPAPALAGKDQAAQSGRALLAKQQGGLVEATPFQDRIREWSRRIYIASWERIRQGWTEERWIRVTDDERNVRFVGFNRVRSGAELIQERLQEEGAEGQELGRMMFLAQFDPSYHAVTVENDIAEMMVDIVLDEVPDQITIRTEAFDMITQALPVLLQLPPPVAEAYITASPLRSEDKQRFIDAIKGGTDIDPRQAQAQAALQEQMIELGLADKQADLSKKQAETEATRTNALANILKAEASMVQAQTPPY